jgi:hypothetical protein
MLAHRTLTRGLGRLGVPLPVPHCSKPDAAMAGQKLCTDVQGLRRVRDNAHVTAVELNAETLFRGERPDHPLSLAKPHRALPRFVNATTLDVFGLCLTEDNARALCRSFPSVTDLRLHNCYFVSPRALRILAALPVVSLYLGIDDEKHDGVQPLAWLGALASWRRLTELCCGHWVRPYGRTLGRLLPDLKVFEPLTDSNACGFDWETRGTPLHEWVHFCTRVEAGRRSVLAAAHSLAFRVGWATAWREAEAGEEGDDDSGDDELCQPNFVPRGLRAPVMPEGYDYGDRD